MNTHVDASSIELRYNNALKVLQGFLSKKMAINTVVNPNWIGESDCFWYIRDSKDGKEFRLVDAKAATNELAFDHLGLATALAAASAQPVDVKNLPFAAIEFTNDSSSICFGAFDKYWKFDLIEGICSEISMPIGSEEVVSPDGRFLVFAKDHNLWLKNLQDGEEKPLTYDGKEDYDYGAPSTAWGFPQDSALQVLWSPDSRRLFTLQNDKREVKALAVTQHVPQDGTLRPQTTFHKVAYPGDQYIETRRLLVIDIATESQQAADYVQVPVTRNGFCFFKSKLGWWHKDGRLAYFVDVDRFYKYARVVEFDTDTGHTKVLFEETSDTQINLMNNGDMLPSFIPLPETNELLWYSERSGWAHLYLYDLDTGQLKNRVTEGDWLVREVVTLNAPRREVFIQTGCRVPDRNPYYRDVARVNVDTGEFVVLASSDHDYFASAYTDMQGYAYTGKSRENIQSRGASPTGNYTVVTRSRVDILPESFLVDRDGIKILEFDGAEILSAPDGWQYPEPVKLLAADGCTDIYGVIYRPSNFSPDISYPIISDVFSTPDFPWAPTGAFGNNDFEGQSLITAAALAELGFIVVQIDGRGGAYRNKAFKDSGYGNLRLPKIFEDQVEGLNQLGDRYKYIDMSRVGIYESVGGPGVLTGLLDYPDIFKVGVTNCLHDARLMSASMWGDMYEGLEDSERSFPENNVDKLQGKLLLTGGMLDLCTTPAAIFRVVEALQIANKDFDMLLLPNQGHDFSPYLIRRAWDYFVQHLLGEEPPKEFEISGLFGSD